MYTFTRQGTPYSEVTGLVCRVSYLEFSRAPEVFHPAYLCRIAVRTPWLLATRLFLEAWLTRFPRLAAESHSPLGVNGRTDLPARPSYQLRPAHPIAGRATLLRLPVVDNVTKVVLEY